MRPQFHITYETVTPESAEQGDAAERGYVHPNGGRDTLERVENVEDYAFRLSQCQSRFNSGHFEDCGHWLTATWSDTDFRTGAETRYSLHPPHNITPSSYRRLARALGARS